MFHINLYYDVKCDVRKKKHTYINLFNILMRKKSLKKFLKSDFKINKYVPTT